MWFLPVMADTTGMDIITATTRTGLHCESCGTDDPDTDDGYTTCCNELTCWGGPDSRDRWAYELGDTVVAVVTGACCGTVADAAANVANVNSDGSHLDCNAPTCAAHGGRR